VTVEVSEEQVLAFRARRSGLIDGHESVQAAARAMLGAQSQQEKPSLQALSIRTAGRPTAASVRSAILEEPRTLVRTWGQRDTVHAYDPATWPLICAARVQWASRGSRGAVPAESLVDDAAAFVQEAGRPVCRADLEPLVPDSWAAEIEELAGYARMTPQRLGARRLLWALARRGDVCAAHKEGSQQFYAARSRWFPDLAWSTPSAHDANVALVRRYLAVSGPATVQDVAHHFGSKVSTAKGWMASLQTELVSVECGARKGLRALAVDRADLTMPVPEVWPVRLLPLYDTLLMGHKDKRWTVPVPSDEKAIWRKAAYVAATVLHRGRLVATWTFVERKRGVVLTLEPLHGWDESLRDAVQEQAEGLAAHVGLSAAEVR